MLRYIFAIIILLHGLIHFMGFAKAFNYGSIAQLTKEISKPAGVLWLLTALLIVITTVLFLLKKDAWPVVAIFAAVLSQILILTVWKDARWGTVANVLLLLMAVAGWAGARFENSFRSDVKAHLQNADHQSNLLTEDDLQPLPLPVQKYLRYAGVVGTPKVKNMRIVFEGRMREKGKDWFPFRSVQYNFFDDPARLFFIKARMFGMPVPGYHRYQHANATMDIRLFGLFSVVKEQGPVMNKAETVTLFNDMCLMAPATLIDRRIQWTPVDRLSANAVFTNGSNTISATLYFNEAGQLINFTSSDRTALPDRKQYPFSTPVKDYQTINGHPVPMYGAAVWDYPDGQFVYGEFYLKEIAYNVTTFQDERRPVQKPAAARAHMVTSRDKIINPTSTQLR